jgi:hypothetical protein
MCGNALPARARCPRCDGHGFLFRLGVRCLDHSTTRRFSTCPHTREQTKSPDEVGETQPRARQLVVDVGAKRNNLYPRAPE